MRLSEIMTRGVETISLEDTVQEAARRMQQADVGFLPVIQNATAVGIVTDRDIVVRVIAAGRDPAGTFIGEVMSHGVAKAEGEADPNRTGAVESLHVDEDVGTALDLMRRKQLRRILVHDDDYRMVGVVSLADFARGATVTTTASTTPT
ncbi:MAG: CBS domain-containing protein [Planctomycetales bacterium]